MLKRHSKFFENLLFILDLTVIFLCWFFAYYLRFFTGIIPIYYGIPSFKIYLLLIAPIIFIWGFIFKVLNLYRPRRLSSRFKEIFDIAKGCTISILLLISITFFWRKFEFSRVVFIYFWLLTIVGLSLSRVIFREGLRFLRKRGYNLRKAVLVGDGLLARDVIRRLKDHPELGIDIFGLLSKREEKIGRKIHGVEVVGAYGDLKSIIERNMVDQVFVALPFSQIIHVEGLLKEIGNYSVSIKVIPDIRYFLPFCSTVEEFDGLPVFNLQDSPLYGWNILEKRMFDIFISVFALAFALPFMLIIALAIKLTSQGPVFYRQKRAGLDGKVFEMIKFRTMTVDAERSTGPVWASKNDSRRTKIGTFLRRTSLDELPQFFNVLKGEMSIVGPRPERPEFIGKFREDIPRYMLRHRIKTGITGWAQVNGWRGDTDLKKRIEHDLYYIEHWSVWFDLKIIWLTLWKGFVHEHAY